MSGIKENTSSASDENKENIEKKSPAFKIEQRSEVMVNFTFFVPKDDCDDLIFISENMSAIKLRIADIKLERLCVALCNAIKDSDATKVDHIVSNVDFDFRSAVYKRYLYHEQLLDLSLSHLNRDVISVLLKKLNINSYSYALRRLIDGSMYGQLFNLNYTLYNTGFFEKQKILLTITKELTALNVKIDVSYTELFLAKNLIDDFTRNSNFGYRIDEGLACLERRLCYLSHLAKDIDPTVTSQAVDAILAYIPSIQGGFKLKDTAIRGILKLFCKYNFLNMDVDYDRIMSILNGFEAAQKDRWIPLVNEVRDCLGAVQLFCFAKHSLEQNQKDKQENEALKLPPIQEFLSSDIYDHNLSRELWSYLAP